MATRQSSQKADLEHDKQAPNETDTAKVKKARNRTGKTTNQQSRKTNSDVPTLRRIPISAIADIHEDVPKRLIHSFPLELDDPRQLSAAAIMHLILQHPIGVVPLKEKRTSKNRAAEQQKYAAVTGLATWTALRLHLNKPSRSGTKSGDKPLHRSGTISVLDLGELKSEQIAELATLDTWLSFVMHLPSREFRDDAYLAMQKMLAQTGLITHTPDLSQLKRLADALDKNRTTIGKRIKQKQKRAKKNSADKLSQEPAGDRSLPAKEDMQAQE